MEENALIRKILVPTDGSAQSLQAARYAAEIARCGNAQITLLNAAEVTGVTQFVTSAVEAEPDLSGHMHQTGLDIIEKTRRVILQEDVTAHSKVIEGPAADVILREASDGDYDLIVIGHCGVGAGAVKRLILGLGNVAERVVSNAPCPVMVIRGNRCSVE